MTRFPLAAALLVAGHAAMADPAVGLWQTERNDDGNLAHVEVAPCGAKLCGTMVRAFGADNQPISSPSTGRNLVWDMEPRGDGAYADGRIWDPGSDRTYRSRMKLDGDRLEVSGCVAGGLLCRSQTWIRVR